MEDKDISSHPSRKRRRRSLAQLDHKVSSDSDSDKFHNEDETKVIKRKMPPKDENMRIVPEDSVIKKHLKRNRRKEKGKSRGSASIAFSQEIQPKKRQKMSDDTNAEPVFPVVEESIETINELLSQTLSIDSETESAENPDFENYEEMFDDDEIDDIILEIDESSLTRENINPLTGKKEKVNNYTTIKTCLRKKLHRDLGKREKNILIRLIREDVCVLSKLIIMVSIFINYYYKEFFKRVGREKFKTDCPKPLFLSFFNELNADYHTRSKNNDGDIRIINRSIGQNIINDFLDIFTKSGCEKIRGLNRSRQIGELALLYTTVLMNNIVIHQEKHFIKYMTLKLKSLNLKKRELYCHCHSAWKKEDKYSDHSSWPIIQDHINHFRITPGESWWPTISYLIEAQNELFEAKMKNFEIFPQFHSGLKHVTYSASGFYNLATRFVYKVREIDGKSRRTIYLETRLKKKEKELKETTDREKKKKLREEMKKLNTSHNNSINKTNDMSLTMHDEWFKDMDPNYGKARSKGQDRDRFWSLLFNMDKDPIFQNSKYKFHNYIKTDGVSVSFLFERGTRIKKIKLDENIVITDDTQIYGADPGVATPLVVVSRNKAGKESGRCISRRYMRHASGEWKTNWKVKSYNRRALKAERKDREKIKEDKNIVISSKNLNNVDYSSHSLSNLSAMQKMYEKKPMLTRRKFNKFRNETKVLKSTMRDLFANPDEKMFQIKNQSKDMQAKQGKLSSSRRIQRERKKRAKYLEKINEIKKNEKITLKNKKNEYKNYLEHLKIEKRERPVKDYKLPSDVLIKMGDWAKKSEKFKMSGRKFRHEKFAEIAQSSMKMKLTYVDEFLTTQACSACFEEGNLKKVKIDKKMRTVDCSNPSCNVRKLNRDLNGARNILLLNTTGKSRLRLLNDAAKEKTKKKKTKQNK